MVFAALGLPALFAPLTGQLADRFRRRPLLVINNAAAAAIVLLLLLVRDADLLWLIYVVIFLYANTAYITAAAQSGLLRSMLPKRLLAPANGMLSSIDQGLRIISPLVGAALFAVWGMDPVVLLATASFAGYGHRVCSQHDSGAALPGRRAGRMTIPEFTERVRPAKMDE